MALGEAVAPQFPEFRVCARLNSGHLKHEANEFFDCQFYPFTKPGVDSVLALVGKQEAVVCRVLESGQLEVLAWFHDDDDRTELNSCCWALDPETGDPLLCVSGSSTREFKEKSEVVNYSVALSIRVFDVKRKTLRQTLVGHGKEIEDLVVLPSNPSIVASASMDLTVRLWSLREEHQRQACIFICAGSGHREGLLTLAFHGLGHYCLTGGADHTVKLWHIPDLDAEAPTDHPRTVHYPSFSTTAVHTDYVDCVAWHGDLILSRAANECTIVLWRIEGLDPARDPPRPAPTDAGAARATSSAFGAGYQRLLQFRTTDNESFYMRFGLFNTPGFRPMLAMGNTPGHIFLFDLQLLEDANPLVRAAAIGGGENGKRDEAAAPRKDSHRKRPAAGGGGGGGGGGSSSSKNRSAAPRPAAGELPDGVAVGGAGGARDRPDDPFRVLDAHRTLRPKSAAHVAHIRQVAWSVDGRWMVAVGGERADPKKPTQVRKARLAVYER